MGEHGLAGGGIEAITAGFATGRQLLQGLVQAGLVDVGKGQTGTLPGELEGQRPAYAGAGAGDDDHFVIKVVHGGCPVCESGQPVRAGGAVGGQSRRRIGGTVQLASRAAGLGTYMRSPR
ncbi:hypothetical protein D9M68_852060 [compost metagenome]